MSAQEPEERIRTHSRRKCYLGPEDTIKIMLATDNHIGYMERDPIRGQDAINTFEEILKLAVKNDVRKPLLWEFNETELIWIFMSG